MRVSVLTTLSLFVLGIACAGEPLTGPEAQAAYSRAVARYPTVPGNAVVFIDDVRVAAGGSLDGLDPKDIVRIEILKGDPAAQLYGDEARAGVIRIYTALEARRDSPESR